jgi:transcriptional regulator GlxA family with amidase domain
VDVSALTSAPSGVEPQVVRVAIVVIAPCSMSGAGPVIDALRLANDIDGNALYAWRIVSPDGRDVALGGAQLTAEAAFGDTIDCDWLIVLSEGFQPFSGQRAFLQALARVAARTPAPLVSGIHHGAWWLALAGLLDGHRVAVNWDMAQQFTEQFESCIVSQQIFETDRDRATCCGGQATVDFMLAMIGRQHNRELVERIADALGVAALRSGDERQRIPYVTAPGERHPRLNDALQLMEANIEEPLATDEIAALAGISRRQLERLFKQYLGAMPAKYYLNLRLTKARLHLQRSSQSVVQISLACGFASAAHFSNAYRERFGVTPREERRNWIERNRGETPAP